MLAGVEYSSLDTNMRYVATFGNSDPSTPGDWVSFIFFEIYFILFRKLR